MSLLLVFPLPVDAVTDEKMVKTHNRLRLNTEAIRTSINYHTDYHYKPVWDGFTDESFMETLDVLKSKLTEARAR